LGSFYTGYSIASFNSERNYLRVNFPDDVKNWNVVFWASLLPLGAMFGCIITVLFIKKFGRRKCLMIVDVFAVII